VGAWTLSKKGSRGKRLWSDMKEERLPKEGGTPEVEGLGD